MTTAREKEQIQLAWVVRGVTAITSTIATALLVMFLAVIQNLYEQMPVVTTHMKLTTETLAKIQADQAEQSKSLAVLLKDYTSREQLQSELDRVHEKIRLLQVQQAVLEQVLKKGQGRS